MNIQTLQTISYAFTDELKAAFQGKQTSLPFIRHQLSKQSLVRPDEPFLIITIGGSIYKKALAYKKGPEVILTEQQQGNIPVFSSRELFCAFVASLIPSDVHVVALNFAYAMAPIFSNGRLDGQLIRMSKEHTFEGLVGKAIGAELEEYAWRVQKRKIIVSVANDSVCLLLSGLTQYPWDHVSAGIVGTGMNFALFLDQHTLVNLESAHFDKFPQSEEGKIVDGKSKEPGAAIFEKEVSGAYLYQLFNERMRKEGKNHIQLTGTNQLDEYIRSPQDSPERRCASELMEHSAQLVACQIAGITQFLDREMTFIMEGSLFWKGEGYKDIVEETAKKLSPHSIVFTHIPDSGILGAAKLVA